MSSTNGGNLCHKQVPSHRSKNVVEVEANPAKLRKQITSVVEAQLCCGLCGPIEAGFLG